MPTDRRYSIQSNRLVTAYYKGMQQDMDNGIIRTEQDGISSVLLRCLDGAEENCTWGRFRMEVEADPSAIYTVHIFALNNQEFLRKGKETKVEQFLTDTEVEDSVKYTFLAQIGEVNAINRSDLLLYELTGRYLWIFIEIQGKGQFRCKNLTVDVIGDNFLETFPEVYQERNSFFHRYISVFSSMYNDFQRKITNVHELLDVSSAPIELLEIYAAWFGVDVKGGFLTEDRMRILMGEIYDLVKCKGTGRCLERAAEIALGEKPVIIERNMVNKEKDRQKQKIVDELYGSTPYDILVLTTVEMREDKKAQLTYFLEQFKPVRCHMNVIFLKEYGEMDNYTYLGVNAALADGESGMLDDNMEMDQMIIMQ